MLDIDNLNNELENKVREYLQYFTKDSQVFYATATLLKSLFYLKNNQLDLAKQYAIETLKLPRASAIIKEQAKAIIFSSLDKDYNTWYETETFNDEVYKQIPNLKKYYAAGGEPTIIDKNYEFMEYMVTTGHSKHIELQISTNLTNTKKDFYSLLPHFKKVAFLASIDGVGLIQEYTRYPSNWKQIDNNFRKVIELPNNNILITITPVLQKSNLEYITDLFEYAESFNRQYKKNKVTVAPIILSQPDYYDFAYLPLDYKTKCLEKIDEWVKNHCKYQGFLFHARLKTIREKCKENVEYTDNLKQFFKYTDIFDNHRNHYLKDVNPNLANLRDK